MQESLGKCVTQQQFVGYYLVWVSFYDIFVKETFTLYFGKT